MNGTCHDAFAADGTEKLIVGQHSIDDGREIDWGKASRDYSAYRPGYPEEFYELLAKLGVGVPGQRILDLGTGTGALARAFAARGAVVTGVDIAADQVREAQRLASESGLSIRFLVSRVEDLDLPPDSLDAVSAGQSWIYFDPAVLVPKVRLWLRNCGLVVLTHLNWLPWEDAIARRSEELVRQFNPHWQAHGYRGETSPQFNGTLQDFRLTTYLVRRVALPFTRESWRGRIRACRGVGASLAPDQVAAFDGAHAKLLEETAPPSFTVLHQMELHIFENFKPENAGGPG
jgi:SAM-dependent methyltransferase